MQQPTQALQLCAIVVGFSCAAASAQEVVWQVMGETDVVHYAGEEVFFGDTDSDGYEDLALLGQIRSSRWMVIHILSGKDGHLIRTRLNDERFTFEKVRRAGDWNGDGIGDYVATSVNQEPPWVPDRIEVLSGKDDSLLVRVEGWIGAWASQYWGYSLVSDLDTDGDGKPDLVYSALKEQPQGMVYVVGNDGKLRYRLPITGWGSKVGSVGDLDQDGGGDFGVGWFVNQSPENAGAVTIVSGKTGKSLFTVYGDAQGDALGTGTILPAPDIDGDMLPDFICSSDGCWPTKSIVRVFSTKDRKPIFTFRKQFPPYGSSFCFGRWLACGHDLDQDGLPELVVAGCNKAVDDLTGRGGRLYIYSLRDGREWELWPPALPDHHTWFGESATAGRAQPGNPFPVFALTERNVQVTYWVPYRGRVTLYRLTPSWVDPFGAPCAGTLPVEPRVGFVDQGAKGMRVPLADAPSGSVAILALGTSNDQWGPWRLPLSLSGAGFKGCSLLVAGDLLLPAVTGASGNARGYAAFELPPFDVVVPKGRLHAQWVVLGTGPQAPGGLSAAITLRRQ